MFSSSGNGTVESTVTIPYKTQYNIQGSFNFYAGEEKIEFADFFFKGIGFYYNFEAQKSPFSSSLEMQTSDLIRHSA